MSGLSSAPIEYPLDRDWSIAEYPLGQAPELIRAWEFSRDRLQSIRHALAGADLPSSIATVGVAGSLARMEATSLSDCDLVVVLQDDVDAKSSAAQEAFLAVWSALRDLQLDPPENTGIYAAPVSRAAMLDPQTIGHVAEDQRVFGSRFLFLLELQPVWGETQFHELSQRIVDRYADSYVALNSQKQWTYLLNDLVRYFKSLCQTYLFAELYDDRLWRTRNLKARHSRLLMYAGLLFLLGEASRIDTNKPDWLKKRLTWTPLERLGACFAAYQDKQFQQILAAIEQFVIHMGSPSFRTGLAETTDLDSHLSREANPGFQQLKRNGDDFLAALLRFSLDRRDDWADRFFEYWLF